MAQARCSFCARKLDEVSHLVCADDGSMICLACARRSVGIIEAENAGPVTRLPRPEVRPVVGERVPDTRHLDAFLHYARIGSCGTPPPVMPWLCEFLDVYETQVLDAVRETASCGDGLTRANRVSAAFDRMMLPFRGDRRRSYLGAVFDRLLGRSIREGFAYHVDMTVLVAPLEATPEEGPGQPAVQTLTYVREPRR